MASKGGGDEPNTGIWKMVYADFTTAMMAFFLVLWLANTASDAERDLLADYFNPISISRDKSGADGVLSGRTASDEGTMSADGGETDTGSPMSSPPVVAELGDQDNPPNVGVEMTPQDTARVFRPGEQGVEEQLDALEEKLRIAMERRVDPMGLNDVIYIERRPDAVYIQVQDDSDFAMFDSGKSKLTPKAQELFRILGSVLTTVPNTVRIMGHTDNSAFGGVPGARGNWELSAERANAARVVMERSGLAGDRIAAVEGRADREPMVANRPEDPRNRRITVSVQADVSPSSELLFGSSSR